MPHDHPESLHLRRLRRALFGAGIRKRTGPLPSAVVRNFAEIPSLNLPPDWDIHDQGERGACVAHAAVACLEHYLFKQTGVLTPLSEQFLHFRMRALQQQQDNFSDRTWLYEAKAVLAEYGICLQSECLYDPFLGPPPSGSDGKKPSSEAEESAATRKFKAAVIEVADAIERQHDFSSADYVYDHLRNGCAVAVSIPVQVLPSPFGLTNWTRRLGRYHGIVADPDGDCTEGHAVCIIGYLKEPNVAGGGWFVCRNSWGLQWASEAHAAQPFAIPDLPGRGYGVISVGYLDTHCSEIFTVVGHADTESASDTVPPDKQPHLW